MCRVDRTAGQKGFCRESGNPAAARAALHFWEEPCISGQTGSGAVFFSGCNMGCVFCQNYEIAHDEVRKEITQDRLADIFLELQDKKAANINLVTPTHFIPGIVMALESAKNKGLKIPVVYNTSSYENVESLKLLDGLVDIYLPDCKYYSGDLSAKYSKAADYFEKALPAIEEMVRQTGSPSFYMPHVHPGSSSDEDCNKSISADKYNDIVAGDESLEDTESSDYTGPLMKKGTIVRHLLLPGHLDDSIKIVTKLHEKFGDKIYISLMNQYTPMPHSAVFPELTNTVSSDDYDKLIDHAIDIGVENAFIQGDETDKSSFIPAFDYSGL
ncbi:putative pyruvate formate lyase activating enzyme [Butyrivibrio fibrisolvens DSM 3071]|uniref:Putative pyruvate formate lyase activating enzyme n=1 Tax=Butyrivibrio fibrisolvens DSM 3071 TaxID=1121131 RepID=A0A1M5ZYF0_BUTFI|nr:radical SAM protein [Butyrivibrio fibrisolvens]SHI29176.1 putative pyruvate formate lyase activating enzyme [Butyrivibrio fibrisolvens DSM 3071]